MIYLPEERKAIVLVPKNCSRSIRALFKHHPTATQIWNGDLDHVGVQEALDLNLCPPDTQFLGIVRCPWERQLSLYLYRHRQRAYDQPCSPTHFRHLASTGCIKDFPWQMRLQRDFLTYQGELRAKAVLYETSNQQFNSYGTLAHINRASDRATSTLIELFYDDATREAVAHYWAPDFDLRAELLKKV